ncbi:MAG: PBSX family phage terminase large subunit, partial [Ruthenibacterium sp.]
YLQNRFIDEGYRVRMQRRAAVDTDGYRIYGLGEWGEIGGLILTGYVVEEFEASPAHFDYMVNAQDFGFNHANCIGEVGFKDGELFLCREIYEFEKDTTELIAIANKSGFRRDIVMYCDSAEPDRIKMWRKAGYVKAIGVEKGAGSVKAQIDLLKGRRIHIRPCCKNTIKEIGQWKWRKDTKTGLYTDEPVPFMDDAMAMLRYAVEAERAGRVQVKLFKGGI